MGTAVAFGMFGGLLYLLIFLALIAASIRAIVVTVRVPPRVSREPACELCGYRVSGLAALRCPECGTDLRTTGIITLPMEVKRRGSILGAVTGWVFLMLIVGGIGVTVIRLLAYQPASAPVGSMTTTTITPLTPASGAYTRLDSISTINYGAMPRGTTDIDLVRKDGSVWKLRLAPLGASYTVVAPDGNGTTTAPDDGKAADALFASAGLDLTDAKVSAEARELSTILGITAASPYTPVSSIRMRALTPGPPATTTTGASAATNDVTMFLIGLLVGGLVWLAVLILGILFIVSRRRKLLREHPAGPATVPAPPGA